MSSALSSVPSGLKGNGALPRRMKLWPGLSCIPDVYKRPVHIRPGEVVGLVGPSGAGKTTFASLLPRFYDVSSGALRVDGVDVRDASLQLSLIHI